MQCISLIITVATILLCLPDKYWLHAVNNLLLPSNIVKSLSFLLRAPAAPDKATRWQPAIGWTPTFSSARSFPLQAEALKNGFNLYPPADSSSPTKAFSRRWADVSGGCGSLISLTFKCSRALSGAGMEDMRRYRWQAPLWGWLRWSDKKRPNSR